MTFWHLLEAANFVVGGKVIQSKDIVIQLVQPSNNLSNQVVIFGAMWSFV